MMLYKWYITQISHVGESPFCIGSARVAADYYIITRFYLASSLLTVWVYVANMRHRNVALLLVSGSRPWAYQHSNMCPTELAVRSAHGVRVRVGRHQLRWQPQRDDVGGEIIKSNCPHSAHASIFTMQLAVDPGKHDIDIEESALTALLYNYNIMWSYVCACVRRMDWIGV